MTADRSGEQRSQPDRRSPRFLAYRAAPSSLASGGSPQEPSSAAERLAAGALAGKKVLVVDDDFRNIFAVTALLERGELEVISADSGAEGIAALEHDPDIDIVLLDIMMPAMDGYETMRSDARRLPVAKHRRSSRSRRRRATESGSAASTPAPRDTSPSRSKTGRLAACPQRVAPGRRRAFMIAARSRFAGGRRRRHRPTWSGPPPAILVVNDTAVKRVAIRAMLAPLGHEIVEADSGRAALRAVLRQTSR